METDRDAAMAKERQQQAQEAKKRDQQVKALYDSTLRLQKELDKAHAGTNTIACRFVEAAMADNSVRWIHELEENTQQLVCAIHFCRATACFNVDITMLSRWSRLKATWPWAQCMLWYTAIESWRRPAMLVSNITARLWTNEQHLLLTWVVYS